MIKAVGFQAQLMSIREILSKDMVAVSTKYPYSPRAKPRTCGKHVTYYEDNGEEFFNLMTSETYVDITILRRLSRYGIPGEMRSEAWKFLLEAERADRTDDMERAQAKEVEFLSAIQTTFDERSKVRTEVNRLQRRYDKTLPMSAYENVIGAYLHNNPLAEFSTDWVHLCTPFILLMSNRVDVYHCFKQLLQKLDKEMEETSLEDRVISFQSLFRRTMPDLYEYFEEEQVCFYEWVPSWIGFLLSKQLSIDSLFHLWDFYFSDTNFMETHRFFCLAILMQYKEYLEEAEHSEIRGFLGTLPPMDIFMIRQLAIDLRYNDREDHPNEYDPDVAPVI